MKARALLMVWLFAALAWGQGAQGQGAMDLPLERAVQIALAPDGNTRVALAREAFEQAKARSAQARGYLLPNVDGAYTYSSFTRNLAAFGVSTQTPIPIPGFGIPSFVGPITNSDLRATASLAVLDLSAIKRYQGARVSVEASRREVEAARNQATAAVAKMYMAARRAEQALETANANVALAQRTLRLAQSQKDAGTGTGIEVTRAEVLVANERQRQAQAQEEMQSARLQLARAMGLPLETEFALTTPLAYVPSEVPQASGAIRGAVDSRPEMLAQVERQKAAQLSASASKWERLPSIGVFGDYGNIGTAVGSGRATRTAGVQVRIPLFDGGRRDARRQEAASVARQESIRTRDTKAQVELEVRLAIEALRSAEAQIQAALVARAQAEKELAQAERRFAAGVAPGFEVTDAQTRLARAREAAVNALFRQKAASIDYGAATGNLDSVLR